MVIPKEKLILLKICQIFVFTKQIECPKSIPFSNSYHLFLLVFLGFSSTPLTY